MASLRVRSPKAEGNRNLAAPQGARRGVLIGLHSHVDETRNRAIVS